MGSTTRNAWKFLLAVSIGAFIGGVSVIVAGNMIPKLMSRMMGEMMSNMMTGTGEDSCSPAEF